MPDPIITLTTDFGEGSPYVAEMKGAILSICPEARIVDVTHSVPPQDIRRGAWVLAQTTVHFPPGSIHVAVIDPGVGTSRKIAYAEIDGRRYIAPDNGLWGLLLRGRSPTVAIELTNRDCWRREVSSTFHGRDIMGPAAAHLARGAGSADLGPPLRALTPLDWREPAITGGRIEAEIAIIDSFGNLITNVEAELLMQLAPPGAICISVGGQGIRGLKSTYGEAAAGRLIALIGSHGYLEIAEVGGNAKKALSANIGERVHVTAASETP